MAAHPSFTSPQTFRQIQDGDTNVQIVGYIDLVEKERSVGGRCQHRMLKFFINNAAGNRVQVVAWDKEIDKFSEVIRPYRVVNILEAAAKHRITCHNNGTEPYEIVISKETTITVY